MNATPAVYSAGILRFYASGTSTPMNVYANSDLTSASTTITLNSAGRPSQDIFLSTLLYKVTLEDSLGNVIWTVDPYMTSDYTTLAKIQGYSGNPNGFVAGTASAGAVPADAVWDRTNKTLYVCTVTGVAAAAVWTVANVTALSNWTTAGRNVSPTAGIDFGYNTTLNTLDFWNGTAWISPGRSPTAQRLTSGTTYTPTTGTVRIRVRMIGQGGGGGAQVVNAAATAGSDTTFTPNGGSAWTAKGGSPGVGAGGVAGAGGTAGGNGTGTLVYRVDGQSGARAMAGAGATLNPAFGGGTLLSYPNWGPGVATVGNGAANSGQGGMGGTAGAVTGGSAGGGGEYVEFWVTNPGVSAYVIGAAAGVGGTAGTNAGGSGGSGLIIVEEFYS